MTAKTILVADTDAPILRLVAQVLRKAGYNVLAANSADSALRAFDRRQEPLDLLITDVALPSLDGKELARRIGARQPGLPVLFLSGQTTAAGPPKHARALLAKPFSVSSLLETVRKLIEEGRETSAGA